MFSTLDEAVIKTTEGIFNDMKLLYCEFHKIRPTNFEAHIDLERICGLPDQMKTDQAICAFPFKTIKWAIVATIPGVMPDRQRAAYEEAWRAWEEVSGIKSVFVTDTAEAHVRMGARRIDGRNGVLAESELPCGRTVVNQWYDTAEDWVRTSLMGVACHELGHALGLSHSNDGGLMDPIHNPNTLKPKGRTELAEIQRRYGKPDVIPPVPPPTPPPVDEIEFIIRGKGRIEIPGYRITKLAS